MSAVNSSSLSTEAFAGRAQPRLLANLPLRAKLLLAFLLMTVLATSAVALFSDRAIRAGLTADVGERLHGQTQEIALGAGAMVQRQIDTLRAFSLNKMLHERVKDANGTYAAAQDVKADLLAIDKHWTSAPDNDPVIHGHLTNATAAELQTYRNVFPDNVEVFVTDRYGALVGATSRTSNYYQADKPWWQAAWNDGKGAVVVSQPVFDEGSKTFSISIAVPLYDDSTQAVSGILHSTYRLDDMLRQIEGTRFGATGRARLVTAEGSYVTSDGKQEPIDPALLAQMQSAGDGYIEIAEQGVPNFVSRTAVATINNSPMIAKLGWSIVLQQQRDESLQPVNAAAQTTLLISLGTLVIAGLLALVVAQLISRPILRLTGAARQLAAGDLSQRLALGRNDEIGVLANSFDSMAEALETRIVAEQDARAEAERLQATEAEGRARLEQAVGEYLAFAQRVAEGDLTQRIDVRHDGALGQLGLGLNGMVASLHSITAQVHEATTAIAAATAQILAATTEQAASSAEQSAAITETATSVEEVKVIAQQTAQKASQIAAESQSALQIAQQGSQAIDSTTDGMTQVRQHVRGVAQVMQTMSGHSQAIGTTIATLSELADQITSLAQNAAIEATRSGAQDRDLSDLARLVRGLAERAKTATGDVRERLGAIQQATNSAVRGTEQGSQGVEEGAALVGQAGAAIRRLAFEVEHGAQANVQMAAAAQQQMIGMEQIGQAMMAIQQATTQALAGTQQAEQAAQDLHALAQSLQQAITTYRL